MFSISGEVRVRGGHFEMAVRDGARASSWRAIRWRMRISGAAYAMMLTAGLLILPSCSTVTKMPAVDKAEAAREAETEHEMIIRDIAAQYQRLSNVAFPMLERSTELCQNKTNLSVEGIWANNYAAGKDYKETMARMGYGETATLVATGGGSALTAAGIVPGDTLTAIDGWPVPNGEDSVKQVIQKFDEVLKQHPTIRLSMVTKNGPREIDVTGHPICGFNFAIIYTDIVS